MAELAGHTPDSSDASKCGLEISDFMRTQANFRCHRHILPAFHRSKHLGQDGFSMVLVFFGKYQ